MEYLYNILELFEPYIKDQKILDLFKNPETVYEKEMVLTPLHDGGDGYMVFGPNVTLISNSGF